MELHEKVKRVLITGGSRGIGLATAERLLESGAEVYYCSRRPSSFRHPSFRHIPADLGDATDSCRAVVDYFTDRGVTVDAFIGAAGAIREALIPHQDDRAIEEQLAVNLVSHMKLIRWVVVPMLEQRFGRIVAVSSTAAPFPAPGQSVYAAAKAGQEAFLRGCAIEFARKGITCNWVVPGYIRTDFSSRIVEDRDMGRIVPMGRTGECREAADAILYFLGPHSSYATGTGLIVDGGLSLAVK